MPELIGNSAIETAAIVWVMSIERAAGREPRATRNLGAPTDIASPPRVIEVKAFGTFGRGHDLWLETRQMQEAQQNPYFYLYVVENVRQGDPVKFTLKVLGGALLERMIGRAKLDQYFTVPWPVADYDTCPDGLDT